MALAISVAAAYATTSRAEYVAQVDPICHSTEVQARKAYRKGHLKFAIDLQDLRSGDRDAELRVAKALSISKRFGGHLVSQIAEVSPPPGDEQLIGTWVDEPPQLVQNSKGAVHAIRARKPRTAYRLLVRALGPLDGTETQLESFGFKYCV